MEMNEKGRWGASLSSMTSPMGACSRTSASATCSWEWMTAMSCRTSRLDPAEILVEFSGAAEGLFRVDGATQDVVEEAEETNAERRALSTYWSLDMLAVEPLRGSNGDEREGAMGSLAVVDDFADGSLFEDISFGDLFVGMDDGDVLPDLELDPAEILVEFSGAAEGLFRVDGATQDVVEEAEETNAGHGVGVASGMVEEDLILVTATEVWSASPEGDRGGMDAGAAPAICSGGGAAGDRQSSALKDFRADGNRLPHSAQHCQPSANRSTPILFFAVQPWHHPLASVNRVPLTRRLLLAVQKYRSHRKSLLARQAEAASWSQRRQMYSAGTGAKRGANPWLAPTVVLPPPAQAFRPLHVWGHPAPAEPPLVHMWPFPPPPDPPYWHHHFQRVHTSLSLSLSLSLGESLSTVSAFSMQGSREGWVAMTQGTPCLPQPMAAAGFAAPHLAGIVPHPMYRPVPPPPPMSKQQESTSQLRLDAAHPTEERIDAAIGDVLAKPWLPMPLRLKPPSLDSVLAELQKQGVSKVPPASG
ncbi:hypothetical protein C4D60_Mb06t06960 [Musa balbisiana]|uniref:Uncharacterized protein n=1 Tax=Musa balbisiana TaxID=52838 RepID=A0A4S8INM6_MUSBA|nr:hypothetical protein C4D60_Mb06t06960 [Musa balbisiana]